MATAAQCVYSPMALLVLSGPYSHSCSMYVQPRRLVGEAGLTATAAQCVYGRAALLLVSGPFGHGCSMCIATTALLCVSEPFGPRLLNMCIAATALFVSEL